MTATPRAQAYAIDASRVCYQKVTDPQAPYERGCPDSVWVTVIGRTIDDVTSIDARNDVTRYVTQVIGPCDGYDHQEGPVPDDGKVLPRAVCTPDTSDARATMSADEYLNYAAQRQMAPKRDNRYAAFYRVRRLQLV